MKHFLLLVTLGFFAALPAAAGEITPIDNRPEHVNNLLVNGDFEDKGYVQSDVMVYDWITESTSYNADSIPGWKSCNSVTNGSVGISKRDDESQYVHYQYSDQNGWTGFGLMQDVEGLVKGKEYTLDLLVAHKFSNKDANISYGIEINDTKSTHAEEIINIAKTEGDLDAGDGIMDYYVLKFTPISDGIRIFLLGYNYGGSVDNKNGNAWINWDEVRLYDASETGLSAVAADNDAASAAIYDLQGRRVDTPAPGSVYIRAGKKFVVRQ